MKWWDWMPWSQFSECWVLRQFFHSPISLSSNGSSTSPKILLPDIQLTDLSRLSNCFYLNILKAFIHFLLWSLEMVRITMLSNCVGSLHSSVILGFYKTWLWTCVLARFLCDYRPFWHLFSCLGLSIGSQPALNIIIRPLDYSDLTTCPPTSYNLFFPDKVSTSSVCIYTTEVIFFFFLTEVIFEPAVTTA